MIKIIPLDPTKKVIDHKTLKRLPAEGIFIPKLDTYWKNRIKDGDIKVEEISSKKTKGKK